MAFIEKDTKNPCCVCLTTVYVSMLGQPSHNILAFKLVSPNTGKHKMVELKICSQCVKNKKVTPSPVSARDILENHIHPQFHGSILKDLYSF